jgi:hypothetical protein
MTRLAFFTCLVCLGPLFLLTPPPLGRASEPLLKGAFTPQRAMRFVYGSYDYTQAASVWRPIKRKSYPQGWPDQLNVHLLLDASYVQAGQRRHLVVTWATPQESFQGEFTCHACGTLIGIMLFAN